MDATSLMALVAYIPAAAILTITPGSDTVLVVRSAAGAGSGAGIQAAIGVALGCMVWAAAAAVGLGALVAASPVAYEALKWTGAAYLVWLGFRMLAQPRTSLTAASSATDQRSLAQGFLSNVLNPKVGVFYVSFLPQFIPTSASVAPFILLLGAIHAAMCLVWLSLLARATRKLAAALQSPGFVAVLDRLAGLMFIGFGIRLALSARR
jgi:threonine/homoserine/homoserine lactone efflux protein